MGDRRGGLPGRPVVAQIVALGGRVLCADPGDRAAAFVAEHSLADLVTPAALDVGRRGEWAVRQPGISAKNEDGRDEESRMKRMGTDGMFF